MREKENVIDKIAKGVKTILQESKNQSVAHRWDHLERVCRTALKIAKGKDGVEIEVLKIAALLHDLDHPYNKKQDHVKRSVRRARRLLREVGYPKDKIEKVLEVISTHSSEDIRLPETTEGKILLDADRLDGVGAIGIARALTFCGQCGMTPDQAIDWYRRKIRKASSLLQTKEGKQRISKGFEYVDSFMARYEREKRNSAIGTVLCSDKRNIKTILQIMY